MKLILVLLLAIALSTKTIVEHYHYHFKGPAPRNLTFKTPAQNPTMRKLSVITEVKCIEAHLDDPKARQACLDRARSANGNQHLKRSLKTHMKHMAKKVVDEGSGAHFGIYGNDSHASIAIRIVEEVKHEAVEQIYGSLEDKHAAIANVALPVEESHEAFVELVTPVEESHATVDHIYGAENIAESHTAISEQTPDFIASHLASNEVIATSDDVHAATSEIYSDSESVHATQSLGINIQEPL